jgi:hypothetical protein
MIEQRGRKGNVRTVHASWKCAHQSEQLDFCHRIKNLGEAMVGSRFPQSIRTRLTGSKIRPGRGGPSILRLYPHTDEYCTGVGHLVPRFLLFPKRVSELCPRGFHLARGGLAKQQSAQLVPLIISDHEFLFYVCAFESHPGWL